jgi:hypothetical protein
MVFSSEGFKVSPSYPYNVTGCGDPASGFLSLIVTAADEFPAVGTIEQVGNIFHCAFVDRFVKLDTNGTALGIPHSMFNNKANSTKNAVADK